MRSFLEKRIHWLLSGPSLALLIAMTLYPTFFALYLAFTRYNLVRAWIPRHFIGLHNFVSFFSDSYLGKALVATFKFGVATVALQVVVGFFIAWLLYQKLRGSNIFRIIFLIPMMVVPVVTGLVWSLALNPDYGIVNWTLNALGLPPQVWLGPNWAMFSVILAETWQWIPFAILIFMVALEAIPREYYEAAAVDGASAWDTFRHITLPNLRWAILIVVIFKLSDAVKSFDVIYALTGGGPGVVTQTLALYIKRIGFTDFEMGYAAALSFLLLIITIAVLTPLLRRMNLRGTNQTG